jgi:hypothetical protein
VTEQGAGTGPEPGVPGPATCPWCAAPAAPGATRCTACGAALAQRESIGDLRIPGLTSVDPALEDFDKRPLHLRGPSPSQGVAPALIMGAVAGGPIGLVAIGGVAAVAGTEFLGTRVGGPGATNPEDVGKPSEAALQALGRLGEAEATDEDGMSIWRDLPAASDPSVEPGDVQGG